MRNNTKLFSILAVHLSKPLSGVKLDMKVVTCDLWCRSAGYEGATSNVAEVVPAEAQRECQDFLISIHF